VVLRELDRALRSPRFRLSDAAAIGDKRAMSVNERPTARAHRELAALIREGDLVIDATAGNGHDTAFLAARVGAEGKVLAFDIQAEAIASAGSRVEELGLARCVTFLHASHATLADHVAPGAVAAVVFNLGYLPGGDHSLITRGEETLLALDQALVALKPGGLLVVVCYPGHPGGDRESEAVVQWSEGLEPGGYRTELVRREGTLRPAPFLVMVKKN
jgi:predicted methyltransferase